MFELEDVVGGSWETLKRSVRLSESLVKSPWISGDYWISLQIDFLSHIQNQRFSNLTTQHSNNKVSSLKYINYLGYGDGKEREGIVIYSEWINNVHARASKVEVEYADWRGLRSNECINFVSWSANAHIRMLWFSLILWCCQIWFHCNCWWSVKIEHAVLIHEQDCGKKQTRQHKTRQARHGLCDKTDRESSPVFVATNELVQCEQIELVNVKWPKAKKHGFYVRHCRSSTKVVGECDVNMLIAIVTCESNIPKNLGTVTMQRLMWPLISLLEVPKLKLPSVQHGWTPRLEACTKDAL